MTKRQWLSTIIVCVSALLAFWLLTGCSLASRTVRDVDRHIMSITEKSASTECLAGFYSGVAFGTDNLKIAKAVVEMEKLVEKKDSADYRKCRAKGLEVSILAISGKENLDDAIKRVMSLGLF